VETLNFLPRTTQLPGTLSPIVLPFFVTVLLTAGMDGSATAIAPLRVQTARPWPLSSWAMSRSKKTSLVLVTVLVVDGGIVVVPNHVVDPVGTRGHVGDPVIDVSEPRTSARRRQPREARAPWRTQRLPRPVLSA